MPCYTAWNEYLQEGSPSYAQAKEQVLAKLASVRHIVNHYYRVARKGLPQMDAGTVVDPFHVPKTQKEAKIREAIAHHFACDGIDFCTLYDVCSLLDRTLAVDRAYEADILPCATAMRSAPNKFA